jgi:hypothetical protein
MIEVRPSAPGTMLVTFTHPCVAETVAVVGEFNSWDQGVHVMAPGGDGVRTITLELPAGRRYRFRYLLEGARWENDWGADDYVDNEFSGDDSVVDLTTVGPHRALLGRDGGEDGGGPQPADLTPPAPGHRWTRLTTAAPPARTPRSRRRRRPVAAGDGTHEVPPETGADARR